MPQSSKPYGILIWVPIVMIVGFGAGFQCRDARPAKTPPADPNKEEWFETWGQEPLRYSIFNAHAPYDEILICDTKTGHLWIREPNQIIDLGTPMKPRRTIRASQGPTTP
jgi:hypothetical protein